MPDRRAIIIGALLFLIGGLGAACRTPARHYVPAETIFPPGGAVLPTRLCDGLFLVEAELNGQGPFTLIVDTGARGVALTTELHERLGTVGEEWHGWLDSLRVGPFEARDLSYTVHDFEDVAEAFGARLDGLLGFKVFEGLLLVMDYPAEEVRVERGPLASDGSDGSIAYLEDEFERPWLPIAIGEHRGRVLIDTGAAAGLHLRTLEGVPMAAELRPAGRYATLAGKRELRLGRAAVDARIGPIVLERPLIGLADRDPTVGEEVLRHFRLTFDPLGRRMKIDPASPGPVRMESLSTIDLRLVPGPDGYRVLHILPDVAAAGADLRVGDRVLSINEVAVEDLPCHHSRLLEGTDVARLRIERGGEVVEIDVPLTVVVP